LQHQAKKTFHFFVQKHFHYKIHDKLKWQLDQINLMLSQPTQLRNGFTSFCKNEPTVGMLLFWIPGTGALEPGYCLQYEQF
jgi:hypothetical protein